MNQNDATMRAMAEIDRRKAENNRRNAELDRIRDVLGTLSPKQSACFRELSPSQILLFHDLLLGKTNGRTTHIPTRIVKGKVSAGTRAERGTLVEAVQRVIENEDGIITSTQVLSALNNEGFNFANENPIAGVSAVLTKLCKREVIQMIRKGRGAIPTQYRKEAHQRARATA